MMSEKLENTTLNQSISSRLDSLVRTSALPATGLDFRAPDLDCGLKGVESLASYDHGSHSWKTSQLCLTGVWAEFSQTWPRSGMTRNGNAYRRASSVRSTCENASLSLPTIGKNEFKGSSKVRYRN